MISLGNIISVVEFFIFLNEVFNDQIKGMPRSTDLCQCKDTMQIRSAAARDEAAELTAWKVEGSSCRCCSPQIVLANAPRPSTTVARSNAMGTLTLVIGNRFRRLYCCRRLILFSVKKSR
ncbi:hypothetical protein SAY87_028772 [Trapa incisa]|uniref:Uncharacterized protein n=1 Tax=Trapa incisa TaxID=236973 RepID=A0AAN7L0E4_9MYRT|nr:hypothetical protein SAY87_028772 [Trapa incisa]